MDSFKLKPSIITAITGLLVLSASTVLANETYMNPEPIGANEQLQFDLSIGNEPLDDDWNVRAVVTNAAPGRVEIQTADGQEGVLTYALPASLTIDAQSGEPITIERDITRGLGEKFFVTVRSRGRLLAAAGYDDGNEPRQATIDTVAPDVDAKQALWLAQNANAKVQPQVYHGAKFFDLPVKVKVVSDQKVEATYEVPRGQATLIELAQGAQYSLLVKDSQHFDDSKASVFLEVYPYIFSYVVVKAP